MTGLVRHADRAAKALLLSRGARLSIALGVIACLIAAHAATSGLVWSHDFHPDEAKIAKWMLQAHENGYITDRAYPGGWFRLNGLRLWAQKHFYDVADAVHGHFVQDGAVTAREGATFINHGRHEFKIVFDSVQAGRSFNAFLYVLSALFLYAACRSASLRPSAAFISTAFFISFAAPLEFVHYCESDGALLFSLALTLWLFAKACAKGSPLLCFIAAFSAGFAIACKPSLAPLAVIAAALPFLALRQKAGSPVTGAPWRSLALATLIVAACIVAIAWGFWEGTPAMHYDFPWYMAALRRASVRTYAEVGATLGSDSSFAERSLFRLHCFLRYSGEIGALPLAWLLASWLCWLRRPARGFGLIPLVLLPLMSAFTILGCPFVRRQELLPLYAVLALGAGLPLELLLRRMESGRGAARSRLGAALAMCGAALCLAALLTGAATTAGMLDCFRARDTRAEAQNWLRGTVPPGMPIGLDHYVAQAARNVDCVAVTMWGLPFFWQGRPVPFPPKKAGQDCPDVEYYVENRGFSGRLQVTDPKTGKTRPEILDNVADYEESVFTCRSWAVAAGVITPTFGQPDVRLVSFVKPGPEDIDIPIPLERPMMIQPKRATLYEACGATGLGPVLASRTYGKWSEICFNPDVREHWLVTRMIDGPRPVKLVAARGIPIRRKTLAIGQASVSPLRAGPLNRIGAYSRARIKARGCGPDGVCASFIVASPAEAAREMRLGGDPAAALSFLRARRDLDDASKIEALLSALDAGERPEAEWLGTARAAIAACDRLRESADDAQRAGVTIFGTPLKIVEDFSRMRFVTDYFRQGFTIPAFLPAGHYELSIREISEGGEAGALIHSSTLKMRKPGMPRIDGDMSSEEPPFPVEIEISWSPREILFRQAADLRRRIEAVENVVTQ